MDYVSPKNIVEYSVVKINDLVSEVSCLEIVDGQLHF